MPLQEFKKGIRQDDPAVKWAWLTMILICLGVWSLIIWGACELVHWLFLGG